MNYIGMDIHKQFTFAVVKDEQGKELASQKFDNNKTNFETFLLPFKPSETEIVMESTGVWEHIYEILETLSYKDVKLANPFRTRAIAEARIKTDKVDASTLADLLRANLVAESYIPPKNIRILRDIARERKTFVKSINQIKNKINAFLTKKGLSLPSVTFSISTRLWLNEQKDESGLLKHYLIILEDNERELKMIDDQICNLAEKDEDAKLLMTIPGIAEIRALSIIAEIGDISRFDSAEKLSSYVGLVPSVRQSGRTLHFGRLIKQSSKTLKYHLIEASWNIVRTKESNNLQEFYKRLSKKKGKQKAICAVARKLCCVVYSMLSNKREFMFL